MAILNVICATVSLYLSAISVLIMVRWFYQLFVDEEDAGLFYSFLYAATEPVLYPVRSALLRTKFFGSLPMDFSMVITMGIISVTMMFL